ncbi:DesA family fatty acid desaturase [Candidatus Thiosymbion oneisti]|uniref:DesA family fatty acid desaturase n=1 Tax=Candidatus Thiosymbion oneisti TaxID=589554 RepID=UPI000AB89D48|nr:fatty acid desaturase [Candidatus Thiosymbion oneisti]
MSLYGILDLSLWQVVLAGLALAHVTIVTVTVFLHRSQAHRALDLHPAASHFFRFWLWLTTGMVTREWVAVHRRHHAKCETPDDPHSPKILGLGKVLTEGAELYVKAAGNPQILLRYGHGTPDDWIERRLYSRYTWQGLGLMLILDLLLFGVYGITLWAIQMMWIPFFAAGVINGVGHYWGYRNFETPDASANILPFGLLIGGEELHNNHHAFPSSAKLSSKWWELDLGWFYVRLLCMLGLAKVKKVAPKPRVVAGKGNIDMDTVRAVVTGHMHIAARYAQEVLAPVTRAELCRSKRHCRRLFRRTQRLLVMEGARLDERARQRLEQVLAQSQTLETVYQFRERLRDLWERTTPNQEALLNSLQDWCQQAEATGIQALETFSRKLRSYTLAPVP